MRTSILLSLTLLSLALRAENAPALRLAQTIPLPGVAGRIDHFSLDAGGARLFVAALGNNTVEEIDLKAGRVARTIRGLSEPQGIFFVAELNRLYVANGGDGALRVFDGTSLAPVAVVAFSGDADNVRYDPRAKQIFVGYGNGSLGVVDAAKNTIAGDVPLGAHPESFQLEAKGERIFVNLPRSRHIAVVDRAGGKVTTLWSTGIILANYPMALDEANHRLFVACRVPARLLIFDTRTGEEIEKLDLHGDCDDLFFDAERQQLYASCGEGFIDIFARIDARRYARKETVPTAAGGRTCFFDDGKIFLAVPQRGKQAASVWVFEVH